MQRAAKSGRITPHPRRRVQVVQRGTRQRADDRVVPLRAESVRVSLREPRRPQMVLIHPFSKFFIQDSAHGNGSPTHELIVPCDVLRLGVAERV